MDKQRQRLSWNGIRATVEDIERRHAPVQLPPFGNINNVVLTQRLPRFLSVAMTVIDKIILDSRLRGNDDVFGLRNKMMYTIETPFYYAHHGDKAAPME